jgi:hypothetical protein
LWGILFEGGNVKRQEVEKKVFIIVSVTDGGIMFQYARNNIKLQSPEPQLFTTRAFVSDGYFKRSETRLHLFGIPQE